jgi:CRISPR-associated protein Cas1
MDNPPSAISHSPPPDLVPARMVNEFAYCPRLAYLEWVQGDFQDNADTADGRYKHRVVDKDGGLLPAPEEADSKIHARSVWLSAPEEFITARMDLVEGEGATVTPVDYKRGAVPDLPERAWETDRVQLCAQGLVLRANGYECVSGVVYYIESKTRVPVAFDEALVTRTRELVRGLRAMAVAEKIPPPLVDSPKCPRCSLAPICLPDETRLLMAQTSEVLGQPEVGATSEASDETVRRLMPARDDALPFYVQEQGARVTKSGEVLEAWLKDKKLGESRLFETSHVALMGSVQITTQALCELVERSIPVAFFTTGGWFHGLAHGMNHKNVELRLEQFRAADDPARSLKLAQGFISAKIRNCRTLLMRNHANPPADIVDSLQRLAREASAVNNAGSLFGVEALAAKQYFSTLNGMLKGRAGVKTAWTFDFNGRNRRPPRDPVNALLSYAYALLAKELAVTALIVGFDPMLGFFHQPRYGRPSLALDVMEEFRPLVADSVVLNVINTGIVTPDDFIQRGPAVALNPEARKKFLRAYEARLDTLITHPIFGYKISYRRVLEVQLRLLGRTLSRELPEYPAFLTR